MRSQGLQQQLKEHLLVIERQAKELEAAKVKQKAAVDNMLLAQKQINEMLQLSPSKERTQLMLELQTL